MTLLIKIVLFPVTHKSYESTARMQEIQPMIKEIQDKYKDDPQKLNAEKGKVYKEQGVSPPGRLSSHAASDAYPFCRVRHAEPLF